MHAALLFLLVTSVTVVASKVIIVGGGLSGLMAAWKLSDAGIDFLLLESRDVLGGRVSTLDFSDSSGSHPINVGPISINTGAKWIHGACSDIENTAWLLTKKYNIATNETDYKNVAVFNQNRFCETDEIACTAPYDDIEKKLDTVNKDKKDSNDAKKSLRDALKKSNWNPAGNHLKMAYEWYHVDYEYAASADQLAAFRVDLKVYENEGKEMMVTDSRGFAELIRKIAAESGIKSCTDSLTKLQCSSIVTNVNYGKSAQNVTVTVQNAISGERTEITADYVLITVSLGVLQNNRIVFDPPLPTAKESAIDKFGMGNLTTIFAKFNNDFWSKPSKSLFSNHSTSDNITQNVIAASIDSSFLKAWVNLAAYNRSWTTLILSATGSQSSVIESRTVSENQNTIMQMLRKIYQKFGSVPDPINFYVPRWGTDKNFYGAYSFWPVGFEEEDHEHLRSNVGERIFFAGEATSQDFFGFLQGAICTGLDQAEAIIRLHSPAYSTYSGNSFLDELKRNSLAAPM
ncbi:uncharacterized protein [Oscarella lobularis]|uniref:uncharacterized protein isoform X2 n=1 Tax=Oscarella lobularis TaxID=121494 RepID=UPI0033139CF3